jgi:Cu2+-exporting ATPase
MVKAPDALERLAEVDTVVFDKTGTLTRGEPALPPDQSLSTEILKEAASLAAASRHPYARAVVRAAEAAGLVVRPADRVRETPGFGLEADTGQGSIRLGSAAWCGLNAGSVDAGVYYRAVDRPAVAFSFEDPLRSDAKRVLGTLQRAGFHTVLLSGDRPEVVRMTATAVGIPSWHGNALPADKIARISELKASGARVLMVGDGLNDAPALAAGHASLSPADAADIAQTAADAVFQGDRLEPVVEAIAVGRAATSLALQNFGIAIAYNALFVPLAVLGLVTPLLAAIAMSASSIAVTANAIRLRRMRLELRP